MRNMFELSRDDLVWLEDKFYRYNQLDREVAIRKEELKIKEEDTNIGGGKTNFAGNPIETQVIKEQSDEFILTRQKWKQSIDSVYLTSSEEVKQIISKKYWSDESYMNWEDIGKIHCMSKSQVYRVRYRVLERFAKLIGYI
ncbi:MAG TPA: hypothetical protein K8V56_16075 [Sporosarcina psychrophila]|uniref:Transcriptional regulator n=1 Tax=Sporosarcina psychrophila TaxID=1476 RepID=A0A921KE17_SPOPS|nr:hypothetical protein [Sporosarcina psychrophila]